MGAFVSSDLHNREGGLMRWLATLRLRLLSVFARHKVEQELDEELRYHLERQIEEETAAGTTPEEARYRALQSTKYIELRKEECRDTRGLNMIDQAAQDVRYAIRSLRHSPGFTVLVVMIMALGIGANTAVFSVVNAVLLKPLMYRDPDRLVTFSSTWKASEKLPRIALPDFRDWQNETDAFSSMAFFRSSDQPTMAGPSAEYVHVARVSAGFFETFAIKPVLGRLFSPEEQQSSDTQSALISHSFWQSHFAGSTAALGRKVRISNQALTVVGVLPPTFRFPDKSDIWYPADAVDRTLPRTSLSFLAIARVKQGMNLAVAQAQVTAVAHSLQRRYPDSNKNRDITLTTLREDFVSDVQWTLYVLLGAVGLVLLISCANIAGLLLTRATARTREIAIRVAVGAARNRIIAQLLTESLLLAFLSGIIGLLVATVALKILIALAPAGVPRLGETGIDREVLVFTFAISFLCSLLFGLLPAIHASRVDLNETLKQGGTRTTVIRSSRLQPALVIVEIALSTILLSGAGLLLKSFNALNHVELGFRPAHLLLMKTSLPSSGPEACSQRRQFFKRLLPAVSSLPGVIAAGATMSPPGEVASSAAYWINQATPPTNLTPQQDAVCSIVVPGTFAALGIRLELGRDFETSDAADTTPTAIINRKLAQMAFLNQDPIGRDLFAGLDSSLPMKIVGIVSNVRQAGPAQAPQAEIYMPYEQHTDAAGSSLTLAVRTTASPQSLANDLRRSVHEVAADAPAEFTTMQAALDEKTAVPRLRTLLLSVFAGLALSLAVAGVYGVTAYGVAQRRSEIGLRMAMSATPNQMLRSVLRHAVVLVAMGMTLGFLGSLAAARTIRSLLFGITANDPATYANVAALLGIIVLAANYLPARRAARLNPLVALREE